MLIRKQSGLHNTDVMVICSGQFYPRRLAFGAMQPKLRKSPSCIAIFSGRLPGGGGETSSETVLTKCSTGAHKSLRRSLAFGKQSNRCCYFTSATKLAVSVAVNAK
jgi:hypothetical protein